VDDEPLNQDRSLPPSERGRDAVIALARELGFGHVADLCERWFRHEDVERSP
jgi:hypothetical protein